MFRMYKCIITIFIIGIIIISSACSRHETAIEAEAEHSKQGESIQVETVKPQINDYTEPFTLSGNIKTHQKSVLASKIMGQIIDILVEEGSQIKVGQLLLKLDDREMKIKLAQLEADAYELQAKQEELKNKLEELQNRVQMLFHEQESLLSQEELAQATFDRYAKLREKDVATPQEYDEQKTKLDKAKSAVAQSQSQYNMLVAQKSQLESKAKQLMAQIEKNKAMMAQAMVEETYTQIISPLNGVVVAKNVEVGDMATPGSPLLIVENTDNLYLELNVEEANAFMFKPGSQIELTIDAYPNSSVVGVVREVIPSADEDTHTFKVKIDIPPHELLHAGMYARAIMPISGTNIFIPRTALINKGQITGVYVVDNNNIARFRIIKPGQEIQGFVEVISGLTEKDKVVISELDKITDGTKVSVRR